MFCFCQATPTNRAKRAAAGTPGALKPAVFIALGLLIAFQVPYQRPGAKILGKPVPVVPSTPSTPAPLPPATGAPGPPAPPVPPPPPPVPPPPPAPPAPVFFGAAAKKPTVVPKASLAWVTLGLSLTIGASKPAGLCVGTSHGGQEAA